MNPTEAELRQIEAEETLSDILDLAIADAAKKRDMIPLKASQRAKPPGLMKLDSTFKDPANWIPVAVVKVVHQDDNLSTLVGDFTEFKHRTSSFARRLVRSSQEASYSATSPSLPRKVEYVTDRWYIEGLPPRPHSAPGLDVHFNVGGPVEIEGGFRSAGGDAGERYLRVSGVRGQGITRAELGPLAQSEGKWRFVSHDGRTILFLPVGTDVLEGLTREMKLKIKADFDLL